MFKWARFFIVFCAMFMVADLASAAGYTKAQCDKMEREYKMLQQKEKRGQLTQADRKRMGEIDSLTNIYCDN